MPTTKPGNNFQVQHLHTQFTAFIGNQTFNGYNFRACTTIVPFFPILAKSQLTGLYTSLSSLSKGYRYKSSQRDKAPSL